MKTYRINKNAERLAQGTGFAPELVYNISLVRFQGRNGRCIAAWTPGMKRPRYVYRAHTPEEYDKAMERIRHTPVSSLTNSTSTFLWSMSVFTTTMPDPAVRP